MQQLEARAEALREKLVSQKSVLIICGPTGVGKSKLAADWAQRWKTGIISVDSMQVYQGMTIGTDKQYSPHFKLYMVDLFTPDHYITAVRFRQICRPLIEQNFLDRGKIPILAGGSGLYIRAVTDRLKFAPPRDRDIRHNLGEKIKEEGIGKYYQLLQKVDRPYSLKISANDERRIIRGLEVYYISGKPFSSYQDDWEERDSDYNSIFIGLNKDRKLLYADIESRVDLMFEKGLVDEVNKLLEQGFEHSFPLKQAVGYREVIKYIKGQIDLEQCRKLVKQNTRRLAKKQLTWFSKDPRINWIRVDNYDNILSLNHDFLKIIEERLDG